MNENLNFLGDICKDGYMPLKFGKMLPVMETRIEKELKKAGRLKGKPGLLDYDLLDKSLNDFHHIIIKYFNKWLYEPTGFVNIAQWACTYLAIFTFYGGISSRTEYLTGEITKQISHANKFMLGIIRELSEKFESGNYNLKKDHYFNDYLSFIEEKHDKATGNINGIISKIELYHLTRAFFLT
jgi:hypothetical protein